MNGKNDKFDHAHIALYLLGVLPVIWLGLLIAPALDGGLAGFLSQAGELLNHPLQITVCEDSLRAVLVCLLLYGLGIAIFLSNDRNYRRREEHGSAKWGNPSAINKKYADRNKEANKILTQNVAIGLDGKKHRRNLNVLVCGGSGAGKTRFYAKPNLLNANSSYVCLDPNGKEVLGYILQAVH